MADDLAAWLLEQITEDERRANAMVAEYPTPWDVADRGWMAHVVADGPHFHEVIRVEQHQVSDAADWLGGVIQHVETWNPARVLAESDAKRRVINEYLVNDADAMVDSDDFSTGVARINSATLYSILRFLALPYGDRPGYRSEWKP